MNVGGTWTRGGVAALLGRTLLAVVSASRLQATAAPEAAGTTVAYKVVEQWSVPNGGYGRVVVIDPKQRSEAGLRALAEKLRRDTAADRNAFVFIYDNARAASLRKAANAEKLNKPDTKFHDDHALGSYIRNGNTGFHELNMLLQGPGGPVKRVALH